MRTCFPEAVGRKFSEEEVLAATQRFDEAYRLGGGSRTPKAPVLPPAAASSGDSSASAAQASAAAGGCFFSGVLRDGRRVAIQVLKPAAEALGAPELEAFAEQTRSLCRVSHPHVARLLGWASFWERRFWVFEFADGLDFRQLLRGCTLPGGLQFDWAIRLRALRDAAIGLDHLHAEVPRMHHALVLTSILVDGDGLTKVVDYGRHGQAADGEGHEAAASAAAVRALGFVALALLVGEELASHGTIGAVPTEPYVLDFVLKSLDRSALWPVGFAKVIGELALRCVQPQEALRPCLTEVALRLDDLCTQFGLWQQEGPEENCVCAPLRPMRPTPTTTVHVAAKSPTAFLEIKTPAPAPAEDSSWNWLRCCSRSGDGRAQSLPLPPSSAQGQRYGHFWGSNEPETVEFGKLEL